MERVSTQLNDVLKSAFEIFSQQLKVRGIQVVWEIKEACRASRPIPAGWSRCSSTCCSMPAMPSNPGGETGQPMLMTGKKPSGCGRASMTGGWSAGSATRAREFRTTWWKKSSNRFSPPRRWAREPGWGFPSAMASSGVRGNHRCGAQFPPGHLFCSEISPHRGSCRPRDHNRKCRACPWMRTATKPS
jgi:hypothetical protein